jgi:hypothetical protein
MNELLEWLIPNALNFAAGGILCAKRGEETLEARQSLIVKISVTATTDTPKRDTLVFVELLGKSTLVVDVIVSFQVLANVVDLGQGAEDELNGQMHHAPLTFTIITITDR